VRDATTLPEKLLITGAPTVDLRQGNVDLFSAASMASVLSFIGKEAQARSLFKVFSIHIVVKGADPMVVNRVRDEVWNSLDHSKWQMRKLDKDFDMLKPALRTIWNWDTAPPNSCFMLWVLRGSDNSTSHCVGVVGQWIFDLNLTHAIHLVREALDWCCGGHDKPFNNKEVGCQYQCVQQGYIFQRLTRDENKKRKRKSKR